ncbi:hypothetical protein [Streptomyces canus]|uniref:hypothetical protein n=1 Tax=Streptomyces canus TaxID=58343 RepID=UPI0027D8859D|nr:hypothetical protein [Streptomyces canus]
MGPGREDHSDNGDAWSYFTHDQARSRAPHQTGWTGLVAATATLFHSISEEDWHRGGRESLRPPGDREEPLS